MMNCDSYYLQPSRTGDHPRWEPPRTASAPVLSIQEQMGVDPISKLAAAIERLCDVIEGVRE